MRVTPGTICSGRGSQIDVAPLVIGMARKARQAIVDSGYVLGGDEAEILVVELGVEVFVTIDVPVTIDASSAGQLDTAPGLMAGGAIGAERLMTFKERAGRITSMKREQRRQKGESEYPGDYQSGPAIHTPPKYRTPAT